MDTALSAVFFYLLTGSVIVSLLFAGALHHNPELKETPRLVIVISTLGAVVIWPLFLIWIFTRR